MLQNQGALKGAKFYEAITRFALSGKMNNSIFDLQSWTKYLEQSTIIADYLSSSHLRISTSYILSRIVVAQNRNLTIVVVVNVVVVVVVDVFYIN